MAPGIGSIETALRELVDGCRQELVVLSYSLTGGAGDFLEQLVGLPARGARARVVINRLDEQDPSVRETLVRAASDYGVLFQLYDFIDDADGVELHAKVVMADRQQALLGSANLSWRGLVRNYEMAVLLRGSDVQPIARAFDQLLSRGPLRRIAGG